MQKLAIALAALAAMGFSATAFADDATPQAPTAMSDSEMDKVTAGAKFGMPGGNDTFGNQNGCGGQFSNCGGGQNKFGNSGKGGPKIFPEAPALN